MTTQSNRASPLDALHTAALALWLGALVTVGAIAAVAFPIMKSLQPVLPGFRVPAEDHWSIAAGHMMNPAFFAVMIAGIVLGMGALLAWKHLGAARRTLTTASVLLAVGTLVSLGLPMRSHLDAYWAAARAGEIETAASVKVKFDQLHPWSSRALGAQAFLVATALALAVFAPGGVRRSTTAGTVA